MADKMNISEKLGPYRRSVSLGIILTGVIIIFVVVIILPYNHSIKKIDMEIDNLKNQVAAQELQAPLYSTLISQMEKNTVRGITDKKDERLNRDNIFLISTMVKDLAEGNNLTYIKSSPDINSMESNKGLMSVDVTVEGSLEDFRKFIVSLNKIPYLQDVEKLSIRSEEANRIYELRIWLAIG